MDSKYMSELDETKKLRKFLKDCGIWVTMDDTLEDSSLVAIGVPKY